MGSDDVGAPACLVLTLWRPLDSCGNRIESPQRTVGANSPPARPPRPETVLPHPSGSEFRARASTAVRGCVRDKPSRVRPAAPRLAPAGKRGAADEKSASVAYGLARRSRVCAGCRLEFLATGPSEHLLRPITRPPGEDRDRPVCCVAPAVAARRRRWSFPSPLSPAEGFPVGSKVPFGRGDRTSSQPSCRKRCWTEERAQSP